MLVNLRETEDLDPRVRRTRKLILAAFEALLAEKGFEAITVQDITERADINRTTFYAHFPDKYALLDYSISRMFMDELDRRTLNACHYTPDNLRSLILALCEFLARTHSECVQPHLQFEALIEGTIKKQIFELLSLWLDPKNAGVPVEIPATVATWAIYGLASHYSHLRKRPDLETYVDEALPLVAVNLEQFA